MNAYAAMDDIRRCADLGLTHAARIDGVLVARDRQGLPVIVAMGAYYRVITTRLVGPGPEVEYMPKGGKCWWPSSKPSGNVAKWRLKESL